MEKQGITILTGCTVNRIDKHGKEFTTHLSNGSSIGSDQVMFAIGRHPNVGGLGLEKAGVAINPPMRDWISPSAISRALWAAGMPKVRNPGATRRSEANSAAVRLEALGMRSICIRTAGFL